ncbi:MAG: prenyltransferase/squalene oxidase repeat-containing protein [Promethearchaeota archaeon]
MTIIEGKTAYPYLTYFKKEPYKSHVLLESKDVSSFYFSQYPKIVKLYNYFKENLFNFKDLNLESIYWFLLLRKFLKEDIPPNKEKIIQFIKRCEINKNGMLGFKFSPESKQKAPDIWSTYFAISNLYLLDSLKDFLASKGEDNVKREIMRFIWEHKKDQGFLHCLDKDCEIEKKVTPARTIYYVIELLVLMDTDVRALKINFLPYLTERKKDSSLIYKLLCLKYLDADSEVKEKEIEYLHQFQQKDGGFNFKSDKKKGAIGTTFWFINVLQNYAWLVDYNPAAIHSFINTNLNELLNTIENNKNLLLMIKITQLIVSLGLIWDKFIEEIERIVFRKLDKEKYISVEELQNTFGLRKSIEEVISYINLNYTFNLKILDNNIEFKHYLRSISTEKARVLELFYKELEEKSVVSLKGLLKQYKKRYGAYSIKIKDILPNLSQLLERHIIIGKIDKKKFILQSLPKKIIISDTEINSERLFEEKEKLKDIKNDIYNMTLSLQNTSQKIKEEIESYLILDEIDYAKERLKYILKNALMDADFLNENIENSFNQDLYYINLQAALGNEITQWKKIYSVLRNKLKEVDLYLKEKISEKEELINTSKILDKLNEKIYKFSAGINKQLDNFRNYLRESLEAGYSNEKLELIIKEFEKINNNVNEFDKKFYHISQGITLKEEIVVRKHKEVINHWISIKNELNQIFDYYLEGFSFFNNSKKKLDLLREEINSNLESIQKETQNIIRKGEFQEAFNYVQKEADILLNEMRNKINNLQEEVKDAIKHKQKLFLLYRVLQDELEALEESTISLIAEQVQELKEKVIKERNRAQMKDFDNFVATQIPIFKEKLEKLQNELNNIKNLNLDILNKKFNEINDSFKEANKEFQKKLTECKNIINNFDTKSNVTIIQWNNFKEGFKKDLQEIKDEYINRIITEKIEQLTKEKKTNNVKIIELKKELNLKCNIILNRVKDLIEISKLNAQVYEDKKCILVFTEHYYKNKELRHFLDNNIIKGVNELLSKILGLFDSSIKNRTLSVNTLQLKNRIADLIDFEKEVRSLFNNKIKELEIDPEREEILDTKEYFETFIKNTKEALEHIREMLNLFTFLQNFIVQEYNNLRIELMKITSRALEDIEKAKSYSKIKEKLEINKAKFNNNFKEIQAKIETKIRESLGKNKETAKLNPEIKEYAVKIKNEFIKEYESKMRKIENELTILKSEGYRSELLNFIGNKKIHLSQLLGTIQKRVEDDIEIKEFKKAYVMVNKRSKNIEKEIKDVKREIENLVKKYSKETSDFITKNKYILEDFEGFLNEYSMIFIEKVKMLERMILKGYITMAIKAVANQYLTISFLSNELGIKKQNIQEHLIFLISAGQLPGKYDPRLGLYYENPDILKDLDEEELQVIKKMNFKLYVFLNRMKNFTSQYYSIIAFFASLLTISYYIFVLSGGNPAAILIPIGVLIIMIAYFTLKKKKEEKI